MDIRLTALGWMRVVLALACSAAIIAAPGEKAPTVSEQQLKEYQVKAAFLYNFTKFVEFKGNPLSTEETVTVCVSGPSGRAHVVFETLQSQKNLTYRRIKPGDEVKGCAVLFQSAGEKPVRENWNEISRAGTLVVTEDPQQIAKGSILNFYLADGKVRFEANVDAAKSTGFRLNSQLLRLARIAKSPDSPPAGGND